MSAHRRGAPAAAFFMLALVAVIVLGLAAAYRLGYHRGMVDLSDESLFRSRIAAGAKP